MLFFYPRHHHALLGGNGEGASSKILSISVPSFRSIERPSLVLVSSLFKLRTQACASAQISKLECLRFRANRVLCLKYSNNPRVPFAHASLRSVWMVLYQHRRRIYYLKPKPQSFLVRYMDKVCSCKRLSWHF